MPEFDMRASFLSFLAIDRDRKTGSVPILQSLIPSRVSFPVEFRVPAVVYKEQGTLVPTQLLKDLSLSDRLLPAPRYTSFNLAQERTEYTVRKLFNVGDGKDPGGRGIVAGKITESNGRIIDFVGVSFTDSAEYWISIQGSITGNEGVTYSFILEADGAAKSGSYSEFGFESDMVDGCLLRLQTLGGIAPQVEESEFSSLKAIKVVANPEAVSIIVIGEGKVNSQEVSIRLDVGIRHDVVTIKIQTSTATEPIFVGSAPRERVNARIVGGLIPPQDGKIIIVDRNSGEEIRRFPIQGRLGGAAWDGEYLWQGLWPEGRILKFDIRDGGGIAGDIDLPAERMINGVAFRGQYMIFGACSLNIMKQSGNTFLQVLNRSDNSFVKRILRPHAASSGISWGSKGIFAVVSGIDQTPVSSDSLIVILNKETGDIEETIIFPRNFFIDDIHHESDDSILLAVTEGLADISQASVYQLTAS